MHGSYYDNTLNMNEKSMNLISLLKANIGKKVKVYLTIPGSTSLSDKEIDGIIEGAGEEYLIVSNPQNGAWELILIIYIDYVTFYEKINLSNY